MARTHQQIDSYLETLSDAELRALIEEDPFFDDGSKPSLRQRASRSKQRVEKFNLQTVLDTCINARQLIKPEQEKIRLLLDKATDHIERDFREYQIDLIAWQLTRAADAAEERARHIDSIDTTDKQIGEKIKCADGIKGTLRWFHYYAWAFDPRADVPLSFMPLLPFDFQERYLSWLYESIFFYRTGGLVEKSRDMGATLFTVNFFVCQWLFRAGFIGSMVTRKEELVDSKKKKDTLFEKARVQIGLCPRWQLPEGWDPRLDSSHMTLINPENQAELTGEAPTQTVGRQGRATALLADEFAHWPYEGIPQNISMSFTCKSVIKVSSVYGMQNEFAREAHDPNANVFVMDWREHDWKDQRWYNGLGPGYSGSPMSKALIAQEVDRDYTASQPGRVWPMYSEAYTVITYSELKAFFHKYDVHFPDDGEENPDGRVRMPLDWSIGRANDRGATPGHRNAWLWSARPREHQPLHDTVFLFREWIAPIPTTYEAIANYVNEVEKPDNEGGERLVISINSHEAESERQTYAATYGIHMEPWDTDYESGISQVGDLLTVKHTSKPNPFRPELMGRTQIVFVVRDGQGELQRKEDGSYYVLQATDFGGMVTLRRQIQAYHYPPEEAGKPVGQMRPEKKDDDIVDDLRAFALHWDALIGEQTEEEKRRERIIKANPHLDPSYIDKLTGWEHRSAMFALQRANQRIDKEDDEDNISTGSRLLDHRRHIRKHALPL